MRYDRKVLKREAKALIRQARPRVWVVTLVFVLLAVVLPQVVLSIVNPMGSLLPQSFQRLADLAARLGQEPDEFRALGTAEQMVGGGIWVIFVSVLLRLFTAVMGYGHQNYALRLFRRQEAGVDTVFSGFPLAGRAIGTYLMSAVFLFGWILLIEIAAIIALWLGVLLFWAVDWLFIVWIVAVFAAAAVAIALISLRYCLAPYFILSDPDMGVFDSIKSSKATMRGNYRKMFILDMSFLGWGLLVVLIRYLVTAMGAAVVLFTAGGDVLLNLEQAARVATTGQQVVQIVIHGMMELLVSAMIPMGVVFCLAWLVSLPLNLWLRAYQNVAATGFFLAADNQAVIVADEPEDMAPSTPPHTFFGIPVEPVYPVPTPVEEPPAEESQDPAE